MNSYEHTSRDFLPLSVIRSACAGDTDAVEQVLQHYRGYINKLCTGILYDKHGQPHVCIREHHEPIISEEVFEAAQEILRRRAKPRSLNVDGKREKFSRKYAFSCMIECGFCGGTLTRRSWHSSSQYNKAIWQCVVSTKKGKKFCPESKGVDERTIERAFVESYRLLCQNNKDVLDEFMKRTEETLSESNAGKRLAKAERDIHALEVKKNKLVDMRLEDTIDKETYDRKYLDLSSQIEQLQKECESLQDAAETESTMRKRVATFRQTLEQNEVLDTFDRHIFESIVEKVIVGGYDSNGNKDPYMIVFVYKTGFKNSVDGKNFKPLRKNSKENHSPAVLCSHASNEAESMCSDSSDDTQAFVNSDTTGTMTYMPLEQPTFSYRMVVSSTENHALAGILTKAMYAMPDNLVEDLATQYTTYKATNLTLADMIRLHPVTAFAIIVFISWMAVTLIVILNRLQTRRKLQLAAQQKAKEMAVLAEQAQAASKAKSTFLSNMSHDIRTPMNAIIGFTNIALHQDSVPEMHNCLKKIEESSDHLLSLLNDVLDLSRIESGKVEFSPVPANITAVTDSVIEIVKGMLLNRELNFEVHREPLQNPYVMTEPVRIREILVNILNNAVKFTKDGGTIRFDAGSRPGADAQHIVICYRIKDTGIGMSEEFQKKLFDEFAQEENGVRTQYKGTGLGMPISKKYVELMGGTITVDSRKGVGTTFTVEIPMELTNAEKVKKTKPLVQHNDLKGIKVLLAEDNDLNAELATMLLEDLGMTVTRAADGQEVVDLFAEHPAGTYDIILMDIMMPKMDGHQAAKAIRAMYADRPDAEEIPIIALSANAFSEDVQASLDAGMNGHVSKPLNMEEVTKVIERNLNRP